MDQLDQAIYDTVHDAGTAQLAVRLGISRQVLINKVNPNDDRNHLSLHQAQAVMQATGDIRILQAQAALLGYDVEPKSTVAGDDPLHALVRTMKETSEAINRASAALEDGRLTQRELAGCRKEIAEAVEQLSRLEVSLIAFADRQQPRRIA